MGYSLINEADLIDRSVKITLENLWFNCNQLFQVIQSYETQHPKGLFSGETCRGQTNSHSREVVRFADHRLHS